MDPLAKLLAAILFTASFCVPLLRTTQHRSKTGGVVLSEDRLIPIRFNLPSDGEVSLVIEDTAGKRIRNLISQTLLSKGENTISWDGTDDLGRDPDAYQHGVYSIPARFVQPGIYTVRGLWHRPLELRYQMTLYSPGTPPWPTADGTGGWMTNHTPASSVAFVVPQRSPSKQSLVFIGSWISEGGSALSWVDLAGSKLGGRGWIGGNWTGAQYLASDNGTSADPGTYLYVASVWRDDNNIVTQPEIRLTRLNGKGDQPVLKQPFHFNFPYDNAKLPSAIGGIAVHNNLLALSQPALNRIIFVDVKQNALVGFASVPSPRGLAFESDGHLLALSANSLLRVSIAVNPAVLSNPQTILSDLDDPHGISLNPAGHIFISDQGNSNQVKVFTKDGRLLKTFGQSGPLQAGPYNPFHMNRPKGITVDSNGRLWVAEDEFRPKRVSVWNPDGTLFRAFYGPARYGGGGVLEFGPLTRFFYDGMEFDLDITNHQQHLKRIYYRPDPASILGHDPAVPDQPVEFAGHRYFTNTFQHPTSGVNTAFLFLDNGSVALPVAAFGRARDWDPLQKPEFQSAWPSGISSKDDFGIHPAFFLWSDLNGNGQPDRGEVIIRSGVVAGITVDDDGALLVSHFARDSLENGTAVRIPLVKLIGAGVPVYDLAKSEILAPSQQSLSTGGEQILRGTSGWLVQTTPPPPYSGYGVGGSQNGLPNWSYPSPWPGLHASHSSPPPDRPGMLVGTTRLLGGLVSNAAFDKLFFLNGNQGNIYLFTQDGLFVSQLFQDVRQGQLWQMPTEQPNALLNNLTLHDENFFPSVTQARDGKVYLIAGAIPAVVRVDGLETLRAIAPFQIKVTAAQLEQCAEAASQTQTQGGVAKLLKIPILATIPPLDGNPQHLPISEWAPIDTRGVAAYNVKGTLIISGVNLIAAWQTTEPKLLDNSGGETTTSFHTGGGLDLMLQTAKTAAPDRSAPSEGDLRLFITRVNGETRAAIYRQIASGRPSAENAIFRSPWRAIAFDSVQDVSNQVKLLSDGKGGFEASIPLSVLRFQPQPGQRVKADIGILRGTGGQTTQRVYWSNKATAIVSDIPSEAALVPQMWGTVEFFAP